MRGPAACAWPATATATPTAAWARSARPVVRTDAAALWATGTVWWQVPPAVKVTLTGRLRPGVTGKDAIITLCGLYNQGEVLNTVIEFTGPGVATLSIEERLTIANMTTEWGALVGWFPVDEVTLAYMEERRAYLAARGITDRVTADDIGRVARTTAVLGPGRRLRRRDHAGPVEGHAAPERSGHGAGDGVAGGAGAAADQDRQGLPAQLHQQPPGRPRGRGRGRAGEEGGRAREAVHLGRQRAGRGRRQAQRRLADAAGRRRHRAAVGLRALHRAGHRTARGRRSRHLGHQPQLQGPHGQPQRQGLPGQPGGGGRQRAGRAHRRSRGPGRWMAPRRSAISARRPSRPATARRSRCWTASRPSSRAACCTCRRTTSTPTASTARTTPTART